MQLIPAPDYAVRLPQAISRAKRRVVLSAMIVTWGLGTTNKIFIQLRKALTRGVRVCILYDGYYSRLPIAYDELWPGPNTKLRRPATIKILQALQAGGAEIMHTRERGGNPYRGAYHAKLSIVDDQVYSFGGVNFNDEAFELVDYMLYVQDAALADMLDGVVQKMRGTKIADFAYQMDEDTTVLFDGGHKRQSAIFHKACQLVSQSAKVYYVSQMCPSGRLAGLLKATESYCYFNRPQQAGGLGGKALAVDQWRYGIKNLYQGKRYIHAKFILCELKNGTKMLLSGSHNFSWRGVRYGTAEIALCSRDAALWRDLFAFMRTEVAKK